MLFLGDANCVVSGISQNMLEGVSPSIQQLIRKAADKYPLDMVVRGSCITGKKYIITIELTENYS